jgi:hypothetical protein
VNSSFLWWFVNLGITFVWLAIGIKSESWFLAAGSVIYLAIALLVELPDTTSDERGWGEEDEDEGLLS